MAIKGTWNNPDTLPGGIISDKPDAILAIGSGLLVILLYQILFPPRPPTVVFYRIPVQDKNLILIGSANIKIQAPVGMVVVVGITGEIPALNAGIQTTVFTQIPGLIQMVLTDFGIDT